MIISIISSKGGCGSSTITSLLAKTIAETESVLLLDANHIKSQDLIFACEGEIVEEYETNNEIKDAVVTPSDLPKLDILKVKNLDKSDEKILSKIKDDFTKYDNVLIDISSSMEDDLFKELKYLSDLNVLVINQDNIALRAADAKLSNDDDLYFLINKYEAREELASEDEIFELLENPYLGKVSFNQSLRYLSNASKLYEVDDSIITEINLFIGNIKNELEKINENTESFEDEDNSKEIDESQESELNETKNVSEKRETISEKETVFKRLMKLLNRNGRK